MPAREPGEPESKGGEKHAKRQDRCLKAHQPQPPVCSQQRQKHDGNHEMGPAGRPGPDTGCPEQFHRSGNARQNPHQKAHTRGPQTRPRPEQVTRIPVKQIGPESAGTQRDRKRHQHGMDGMAGDRHLGSRPVERGVFRNGIDQALLGTVFRQTGHEAVFARIGRLVQRSLVPISILGLAGCAGDLSILDPAGPAAASIAQLWWVMLAGSALLCAVVFIPLVLAFRRRPKARPRGTRFWIIGLGLGMTGAVLTALMIYAFFVGLRTIPLPAPDVVRISAEADQYNWTFRHPGAGPEDVIEVEGILHLPAGRPVDLSVSATDVIHAFWAPRLAGKIDAIPGHDNVLRLVADQPGIYRGQCAEYCGTGHSAHVFSVVVHSPDSWARFTGQQP